MLLSYLRNETFLIVSVLTSIEPDGMSAPEVVPVNSSTVRVLWLPPLQPNGAVTGYYIYVNDRLYGSVDNSSGSYLLGDLLPFTVYNVQVNTLTKADAHEQSQNLCFVCVSCFCLLCVFAFFRWRCVLFMRARAAMLPRQLLWRTCQLTWPLQMHK